MLDDNVYVNSSTPLSENVKPGDIIVVVRNGSRALIGKHAQVRHEMPNTVIGAFMTGIRSRVPQFINALLSTPAFENEVAMNMGATINQITLGMFGAMSFSFPSVSEQKAIGGLFYQLDSLITLHQRKCQYRSLYGYLSWEQRKLGKFSKKRTTKNADGALSETFTNSAEQGVISQLDYFDHDITNDANISGYYVVQPDDFVYNPRISATAPCGPINRNRLDRAGVMSPLYTVFSVDASVDKTYLEHYFKTSRWHDFMFLEGNSGARSDRFSISDATFFEMPIWCPEISEQKAIAKQLETTGHIITLHQ